MKNINTLLLASTFAGILSGCQLILNESPLHRAVDDEKDEEQMYKLMQEGLEAEPDREAKQKSAKKGLTRQDRLGNNPVHHAVKRAVQGKPKAAQAITGALKRQVKESLEKKVALSSSLSRKLSAPTEEVARGAAPELTDAERNELKEVAQKLDRKDKAKLKKIRVSLQERNKQGKTPEEIARDKEVKATQSNAPEKEKSFWDRHAKTLKTVYYVLGIIGTVLGILALFIL